MLKNKALLVPLLIIIALVVIVLPQDSSPEIHLQGATMGTTYNVKLVPHQHGDGSAIQGQIDAVLAKVNRLMSTYDPDSELSRFNQQSTTEPFLLSPDTAFVLQEALRLGEISHGVLDITVGPLVNLWGFGPQARPEDIPSEQQIANIRSKVGLDKVQLDGLHVTKRHPQVYIDLSTIAKGFGVDKVAELLEGLGYQHYLVEIGGEMRVAGHKGNGQPWRIAVEKPISTQRAVQTVLSIGNNAVATSGDYRNYFELEGIRYSHLIDPRSGYPIQHNLVSVTVIHPSSMTADGLATALNVMGKDEALALARQHNLSVLLIARENGEFKEYTSGEFDRYVKQ